MAIVMLILILSGLPVASRAGTVANWSCSRAYPAAQVLADAYPRFYAVFLAGWQNRTVGADGWLELAAAGDSVCVMARTFAQPTEPVTVALDLATRGMSRLFLNGVLVSPTRGDSGYDLPLRRGRNEILAKVFAGAAGCALRAEVDRQLPPPVRDPAACRPLWETPAVFLTSESVLFDPVRDVLYVSSFDHQYEQRAEPTGFISRVGLDGTVLDERWIDGLHAPCGMARRGDTLYVAEREGLTAIDIVAGKISTRYPIPGAVFLNDVAVDAAGRVYVSDTRPVAARPEVSVWQLNDGEVTPWLVTAEVGRANGLLVVDEALLIGSTLDGCLKEVDLATRRVRTVVSLGAGVVDGIRSDGRGGLLVSLWEGQLFHVDREGSLIEVLDLQVAGRNTADFEYLDDRGWVLVPTFLGNTVAAYQLTR